MLALLTELQRLKNLPRTGWYLRGLAPQSETVAAHTFGVATTAMLLADEANARGDALDTEKVLRLALVHDWAEARLGDLPATAAQYFGRDAKRAAETAAFTDMTDNMPDAGGNKYRLLYDEYETRASMEARLVKAADVMDLLAQALSFERSGARGLDEFWTNAGMQEFGLTGAAREVAAELMADLLAKRASIFGADATPTE